MDRGTSQATVHEVARVGHDLATRQQQKRVLELALQCSLSDEARCREMRHTRWESQEDPPEKEVATQYSRLENPMDRGA